LLFPLEVSKDSVGEIEVGFPAGYRAAEAAEVVNLPEDPGEGGLASLVGAGYQQDAFWVDQVIIVRDDPGTSAARLLARARS